MSPDVDFTLTEENVKSLEPLLAKQGIKVFPKSRQTVEDLEKGGISYVSTSGLLVFRECEFIYEIFQNARRCRLTVDAFAHSHSVGDSLVAAIKSAYPQPERSFPSRLVPTRAPDKNRITNGIGCIGILLFICAILFFAALGIRSFFK